MSDLHVATPGQACCCGWTPPKPKVNNIAVQGSVYCCGMFELGNFNYRDPEGGKKMTHYHKVGSGWQTQANQEPTTKEDVEARIRHTSGGLICTTGAGQEYMEPILKELGFQNVGKWRNPGHANTDVLLWLLIKTPSTSVSDAQSDADEEDYDEGDDA